LHESNPWVTSTAHDGPPIHWGTRTAAERTTGPQRPQPATVQPPTGGLPVYPVPPDVRPVYWWVGCHGGAGVTTLSGAIVGQSAADARGHWPAPRRPDLARVVLVARTHFHGLSMAQLAGRQWASGSTPDGTEVLGLVLVADAPGKLPRPLRELAQLISGGFPRVWEVPWIEELRRGDAPAQDHPAFRRIGSDLHHLVLGGTPHA
jgi:hypothetical protein